MRFLFRPPDKAELPPPSTVHQHNHEPGKAGEVATKYGFWLLIALLIWPVGKFLFAKAGFRNPDAAWANALIWAPAIVIGLLLISRWLEGMFDRWLTHRESMEDKLTQQLRIEQMLQARTVNNTRQMGEDKRLAALIIAIMYKAYDRLMDGGEYKGNESRPWSRRQAGAEVLYSLGETEPVGATLATQAKQWLERHRVIDNEQVRVGEYPDLASIERLLSLPPVVLPPAASEPVKYLKNG